MGYYLYKLKFTSPLHMGKSASASSLDDGQMTIHADTIFAALCSEALKQGELDLLYSYFNDDFLTISDALPYKKEELYLPKPILFTSSAKRGGDRSLKKALKDLEYVPATEFNNYLQNINQADFDPDRYTTDFGSMMVITRVAVKGQSSPLPYHVAGWRFNPDCGLYIVLRAKSDEALELFNNLLFNLGLSGIGGKISSGWGKFEVESSSLPDSLFNMLKDDKANYQMLLGTYLPTEDKLERALASGWYALLRRGGFIRSETYAIGQMKKRTIYMLSAGSCLRTRIAGGIFDVSDNGSHSVWRNGKTLFVGVNI
ncbi:MAG TPA: type III-A CRISPR-associated RAMP protein Csm4 [Syntrophomonadaceae bacterium]|nr:type III-A CRISPR-associated RAMP protein Csm4 [Syntrophomonadaceae bacterium]